MEYFFLSFIAGVLTILAPCVLPVFPVIFGGSLENTKNRRRPIIITISLAVSIVLFTLLLKASTLLISVHPMFWEVLSGGIVILFGIFSLFPDLWSKIEIKLNLSQLSGGLLQKSSQKSGWLGDVLVGASLGPIFASCSPTYGLIVALVLPTSFFIGLINLIIYAAGLALVLILLSTLGQEALSSVKWAVNPNGIFKKALGVLFIIVGIAIATGFIKDLETALLGAGFAILYIILLPIALVLFIVLVRKFLANFDLPKQNKQILNILLILLGMVFSTFLINQAEKLLIDAGITDITQIEINILENMDS